MIQNRLGNSFGSSVLGLLKTSFMFAPGGRYIGYCLVGIDKDNGDSSLDS